MLKEMDPAKADSLFSQADHDSGTMASFVEKMMVQDDDAGISKKKNPIKRRGVGQGRDQIRAAGVAGAEEAWRLDAWARGEVDKNRYMVCQLVRLTCLLNDWY